MRTFLPAMVAILLMISRQDAVSALAAEPVGPPVVEVQEKLPPPPAAEFLAKIAAPAVRPVIKTKQGYAVEVDRSKQILSVHSPKKEVWISPLVEGQQTVEVISEGAPLQKTSTVLARLKKGRLLYTTGENGDWVSAQIMDGGTVVTGWIQKKHLKPVAEDSPPQRSLARQGENFASAAMLIQKGKQFDDGLYAAVELAMQEGLGPVTGKKDWLPRLAGKVNAAQGGVPLAQLFAAAQFGGDQTAPPESVAGMVATARKEFLADEKRSKPLGFYSWSPELESIFRQDRMLQTANETNTHSAAILAVAEALAGDVEARKSYEQVMRLSERLTNPLTSAGYRSLLAEIDAGQSPNVNAQAFISFLPASRSHESDLVMKLYGNKPIPPGFNLMTEVIARLKSGELTFEPTGDSGWYDHQLWSLEPLVRFTVTPESKKLQPNEEYRRHLEELFKGTYALMRETHVKQLELPAPASEAPPPPVKEREKVFIQPDPHVELLPTMFMRRAESYRFVRRVLEETFGKVRVAKLHRQTARGPVELNLAEELDQMERLFSGAYVVACRETGLIEELPADIGAGQPADEQAKVFLRWVASLASDADLAPDCRMMVPVFFDQQRRKTKVWVMLGWESAPSSVDYVQHPGITITGPDGKPPAAGEGPEVIFYGSYRSLATPVFAEVYVTKILNRAEFRRHCDTYQTKAAIVANLE